MQGILDTYLEKSEFLHRFDECFDFVTSDSHGQVFQVEAASQSCGFSLKSFAQYIDLRK